LKAHPPSQAHFAWHGFIVCELVAEDVPLLCCKNLLIEFILLHVVRYFKP